MRVRNLLALSVSLVLLLSACASSATTAPPTGTPATGATATPGATPAATATVGASTAPVAVNFRFDWIETPGDIAVRSAIDQGFFTAEGLNVTTTVGTGSTDAVTLTGAGQFDMGQGDSLAVITGIGAGVPVVAVAAEYQVNPNAMISRPDDPIKQPTDLYGKKYCVQQGSSLLYYQAVVAVNNLDRSKITEVPIGFDVAPLVQKQCDGLIDFIDGEVIQVSDALKQPAVYEQLANWGVDAYGNVLFANKSFAQAHPDAVKGFVKAYEEGIQWAEANPAAALAMMQKVYSDAPADVLAQRIPATLPLLINQDTAANGVGHQDATRWTSEIALALQINLIKSSLTADQIMTNSYQPATPIMATPAAQPSPSS